MVSKLRRSRTRVFQENHIERRIFVMTQQFLAVLGRHNLLRTKAVTQLTVSKFSCWDLLFGHPYRKRLFQKGDEFQHVHGIQDAAEFQATKVASRFETSFRLFRRRAIQIQFLIEREQVGAHFLHALSCIFRPD